MLRRLNPIRLLKNKKFLYTLAALIGGFLLLDNVILPWYVNHGDTQPVPKITDLPLELAKAKLDSAGLQPVEAETRPDPRAPQGTVVSQNPQPDAVVKQGRRIYLTISGGEALVNVPPLRGRSLRDAKFTLERNGLRLGTVGYATSDQYPENTIVEQSVGSGSRVVKGSAVNIVVSRGKVLQQITVPDFLGKTLTEAERLIVQQKLKLGNITYQASFDLIPNTVVDQFPRPGDQVPEEQAIDLFVVKSGKPKEEIELPRK
ncbi:MAG TPA: PASTA domain-containing protein [Bacteroidota bacterium]|nr:PASTA domain-containing protein [Bacteroidota bacterium]